MSKKHRPGNGIVYSTDPDFSFEQEEESADTPPPSQQQLTIRLDTKQRAGKVVTLVGGFTGKEADLESLGKALKTKCGTGGSVKDGQVLLQGNYAEKVRQLLEKEGYGVRNVK